MFPVNFQAEYYHSGLPPSQISCYREHDIEDWRPIDKKFGRQIVQRSIGNAVLSSVFPVRYILDDMQYFCGGHNNCQAWFHLGDLVQRSLDFSSLVRIIWSKVAPKRAYQSALPLQARHLIGLCLISSVGGRFLFSIRSTSCGSFLWLLSRKSISYLYLVHVVGEVCP